MEDTTIQNQINALNQKVDLILEYVTHQRQKTVEIEDLVADISIVGTDIYKSTVTALEEQQVEIDPDEIRGIAIKLIKNLPNIRMLIDLLESANDFVADASPIANEMIIDFTKKLHEFDQKGYFGFITELGNVIDNVITNFSEQDVKDLADNVVTILQTVKNITQPDMLNSVNNAVKAFNSMEMEEVPEYSMWRLFREMNQPEMKKAIGFMVTLLKNLSKQ